MKRRTITSKLLADFEASMYSNEKSSNTMQKYMRDIAVFSAFTGGKSVDKALVLDYKAVLEKEYALTSANSMLAAINSFFKFAGWDDCCVKQFKVQRKVFCSEKSELSKQEYFTLIYAAEQNKNERLSLLIQTICGTGIRVSELQFITVEAVQKGEAIVSCKGKTRTVFLVPKLCKKLLRYAKENQITTGIIFITKSGKAMNRSNIWREMKSLCEQTGVNPKKVFPHNLRHLFARTFYCVEKDIAKLADILGHVSISTKRIYIISSGAEHREKLQNMHLIL